MIVSHSICIRMKNISDKVVKKIKMDILYSVLFFRKCAVCEIVW